MSEKFKKTISRVITVQSLYLINFNSIDPHNETLVKKTIQDVTSSYDLDSDCKNDEQSILSFISQIFNTMEELDKLICDNLSKQKNMDSLNVILRSILRCGVCELMYFKTPFRVVVAEYVGIAKDFLHPNEVNFTNAILDKVAEQLDCKPKP